MDNMEGDTIVRKKSVWYASLSDELIFDKGISSDALRLYAWVDVVGQREPLESIDFAQYAKTFDVELSTVVALFQELVDNEWFSVIDGVFEMFNTKGGRRG